MKGERRGSGRHSCSVECHMCPKSAGVKKSLFCHHYSKVWIKIHQWILKPGEIFDNESNICIVLKCLSTDFLLAKREKKVVTYWRHLQLYVWGFNSRILI